MEGCSHGCHYTRRHAGDQNVLYRGEGVSSILIQCFGDSLTFGARDEYHRGYPTELVSLYRQDGIPVQAENRGVCGDTSSDLAKRFPAEYHHHSKLTIFLIGTNDVTILTPIELFADNLLCMECILGHFPALWCTLPPIGGYGLPNYQHACTGLVVEYNEVIKSIAGDNYVDFSDMGEYLVDTVHFGNNGYKEMARRIHDKVGVVKWE